VRKSFSCRPVSLYMPDSLGHQLLELNSWYAAGGCAASQALLVMAY
jgi:hypothetical protein